VRRRGQWGSSSLSEASFLYIYRHGLSIWVPLCVRLPCGICYHGDCSAAALLYHHERGDSVFESTRPNSCRKTTSGGLHPSSQFP
jgi:hypothetical protein